MHHYYLKQQRQETQELQFCIKCFNLFNQTDNIPIDSFVVVKLLQKNKPIKQLIKSKVYWGSANPEYDQKFFVQFCIKNQQILLLQIFSHQVTPILFGWIEIKVSKLFGSKKKIIEQRLKTEGRYKNKIDSKIIICCKKKQKNIQQILCWKLKVCSFNIQSIKNYYFFSSNEPFCFVITNTTKQGQTLLYKSEKAKNFTSHQFENVEILKKKFQQKVSEYQLKVLQGQTQNQKLIGGFTFHPIDLEVKKNQNFNLKNMKGQIVGKIQMSVIEQFAKYLLSDYIDAGLQFDIICNIDFTASNKKPNEPDSLHRLNQNDNCTYENAIRNSLNILMDYERDKSIPTYGFGAKVFLPNFNSEGKVSQCFPINGDITNPNLKHVDGVLKQYRNCLNYIQMAGPTNFTDIIKNAINQCESYFNDKNRYMVVFILTDGQIHDIYPVIDLVDEYTHLPISFIIVGLGSNDFTQMIQLDGDVFPLLNSKGKKVRDVIQFVDYNQCCNSDSSLAMNILEQLPKQVISYYNGLKIYPKKIKEAVAQRQKQNAETSKHSYKSANLENSMDKAINKSLENSRSSRGNSRNYKLLTDSVMFS